MKQTGLFPGIGEAIGELLSELAYETLAEARKRARNALRLWIKAEAARDIGSAGKALPVRQKALPAAVVDVEPGPDGVFRKPPEG